MELQTIRRLFDLLVHTARLSKFRALLERNRTSRTLQTLHIAYRLGVVELHNVLPESHALFQCPPDSSFTNNVDTPRALGTRIAGMESGNGPGSDLPLAESTSSLGPPVPDDNSISSPEDTGSSTKLPGRSLVSNKSNSRPAAASSTEDPPPTASLAAPTLPALSVSYGGLTGPPVPAPMPHLLNHPSDLETPRHIPSPSLDSVSDQISPAHSLYVTPPNEFEDQTSYMSPEAILQQADENNLLTKLLPPLPPKPVSISRVMPTSEIIAHLGDHGCKDITNQLNLTSSSDFPISNGGFGDVYKVNLRDGTQVAIKTMRVQVNSTSEDTKHLKDAARELHTWAKCDHPNVLKLLGLAKFRDQIGMVSAWMENGSLPGYLSRNPDADRCKISTQICEGLAYLHRSNIIHGDLKGLNVLISDSGTPMLTDFGNAILWDRTLLFTATTMKASISPDGRHLNFSKAQETITGKVPYHGKGDHAVMFAVGVKQELPARPEDTIPPNSKHGNKLWELLVSCWSRQPEKRPRAGIAAGV
ncbi:hypothetical protein FRC07_007331, partial [Ceratobasidium sp. 392]